MTQPMKALAAAAFVVALAGCSTMPPWKSVPSGQQAEYGRIETNKDLIQFLAFSDDPGISVIAIQNKSYRYPTRYAILLDGPARADMRAALEKYESWKGIAQENQTQITKTITTLELQQMYYQDGDWHDAGDRDISLVFTSRIDDNGNQTFFLTLKPSPVFMMRAFFLVYGRDSLVLSDDQAITFSDMIQEDAVDQGYEKAKKKQDVIEMFK
ncbi:MAG TPA: hypothetical protein VL354_05735 [Spirochaetia bacterium]|nr:hypothetical protein [Spirochaetia bacterium]